jgi:hypothetical protein
MDEWSHALIARGPTLTDDGAAHTGSVHVVDLPDVGVARRFAFDEPYARAGWYSEVSVIPLQPCVSGTMWDRPTPATDQPAAFARASFLTNRSAGHVADAVRQQLTDFADSDWLYAGVALNEDSSLAVGLVGLGDLTPREAKRNLEALVLTGSGSTPTGMECHRWQRGGRPTA